MTWMTWIVALVGLLILAGGLLMLTVPNAIRASLQMFIDRRLMPVASLVRVVLGILFVLAAPSTRLPIFVWAMGLLAIVAGVLMPIVGFRKVEGWATWWLKKSDGVIRRWSLLAILLGALLAWAGT
jgi:hypothetical protein